MKIFYVPIEVIPSRYTADWVEQFETEFNKHKVKFETVGDTVPRPITSGSVLDVYSTSKYKLTQLQSLIEFIQQDKIKNGDVLLFADGWFPGIETILYIRALTKKEFYIASIWHAGSYDPYDFVSRNGMRNWAQHQELAWLTGCDIVFVATQFHKDMLIMNSGEFSEDKVFVTGIPFYANNLREKYDSSKKENLVVFPHREEPEKQPEKFDKLVARLKKNHPTWSFVKTLSSTSNRDEYFKLLAKAKVMVSYAKQETFGYSTVEAMALGVYPIVPNYLSYKETVPVEHRYNKENEIDEMVESLMQKTEIAEFNLSRWEDSISNMLKVINVKCKEFARHRVNEETSVYMQQLKEADERAERQANLEYQKELQAQTQAQKEE